MLLAEQAVFFVPQLTLAIPQHLILFLHVVAESDEFIDFVFEGFERAGAHDGMAAATQGAATIKPRNYRVNETVFAVKPEVRVTLHLQVSDPQRICYDARRSNEDA
jgi:hypothetical protein